MRAIANTNGTPCGHVGNGRRFLRFASMERAPFSLSIVSFCLMVLTVVSVAGVAGQPSEPALSASVDKGTARVGEVVRLTLTVTLPEGARLPEDPAVDGIEDLTVVERSVGEDRVSLRFLVDRLTSFEIGPVGLTWRDPDGNQRHVETGPVAVEVISNLGEKPEEAALRPIQDIIPVASKWISWLPWAAAGGILCIAAAWMWRRRTNRASRVGMPAVDPPHVWAEKEIDRLAEGGLFETGDVKGFYFLFSEILRRYMESIRHFPAAEMTTEEIARQTKNRPADQEMLPLLRQADLVKFADAVPSPERKTQDLTAARDYIRHTAPVPTETAGPKESGTDHSGEAVS